MVINSFKYISLLFLLMLSNISLGQITVNEIQDMSFGSFAEYSAGTITISAGGVRSVTGGVVALSASSYSAALIEVKSGNTNIINITYSNSTITDGTTTLTLEVGPSDQPNDILNPSGPNIANDVYIGATLHVTLDASEGDYEGVFIVSFDYN